MSANPLLPLASIVVPTHNRKALLTEALSSCLAQIWHDVEIIIVDDGSTDGTEAFVADQLRGIWAERSVRYVKQEKAGAPAARNRGLSLSRGKYVQFLDSDDILFPDKITLQVAVLEHPDNARAEGCSCFGQIGEPAPRDSKNQRIGVHCRTPREYLETLSSRVVHGMQTSAPLWRRSFLAARPAWRTDLECAQDLEYHIRLLAQAREIKFVDRELFLVRDHPGPRLSDNFKNRARTLSAIRARRAIFETLQTSGHWNAQTQKGFLHAMRTIYANLLACGEKDDIEGLEEWLLALSRAPAHRLFFPALIGLRKTVGAQAVLKAHELVMSTR